MYILTWWSYVHTQGTPACGCAPPDCTNPTLYSDSDMAVRVANCASLDMCYAGMIKMGACVHMQVCMCVCVCVCVEVLCVCIYVYV